MSRDPHLLVKICGLKTPAALAAAIEAGADMAGFVFFPASPRHVDFDTARVLGAQAKGNLSKVALTVDADDALLAAIVEALRPDMLQLHGRETPARVRAVKAAFGLPVMKALAIETAADLGAIAEHHAADRLLFDARAPRDATRPGGLGKPFDWRLLEHVDRARPFMLSGGLDAENVAAALFATRPDGVDVSSGVERAPGDKDTAKIFAFVRAARDATMHLAQERNAVPKVANSA